MHMTQQRLVTLFSTVDVVPSASTFLPKVILNEGWAFIGVHRVNHRYLIKTKFFIDQPIDVTSNLCG